MAEASEDKIGESVVCTRYANDKVQLIEAIKIRRKFRYRAQVVELALDRLLIDEGLLPGAAA